MINHEKLKLLRQEKGITQVELARETKISVDEIGLLERHSHELNPRIRTLNALANFYDVSIDWLCDRSNILYLTPLETRLVQLLRAGKLDKPSLTKALDTYYEPTELGELLNKIHILVPYMDMDTAKSVYKLLTSSVQRD